MRHTVCGVAGMGMSLTPSASVMALISAAGAPMAPASPQPFTPSGLCVQGVSRVSTWNEGTSSGGGWTYATAGVGGIYTAHLTEGGFRVQRWSPVTGALGAPVAVSMPFGHNGADGLGIALGPTHHYYSWGGAITSRRQTDLGYVSGVYPYDGTQPGNLVRTGEGFVSIHNEGGVWSNRGGCF